MLLGHIYFITNINFLGDESVQHLPVSLPQWLNSFWPFVGGVFSYFSKHFMCWGDILPAPVSVYHVREAPVEIRRRHRSLKLELQMVGSCHVGPRNWTWVLCKISWCTSPLNHYFQHSTYFSYCWTQILNGNYVGIYLFNFLGFQRLSSWLVGLWCWRTWQQWKQGGCDCW